MEITIRHVIDVSPGLAALLERLALALDGRRIGAGRFETVQEPGPASAVTAGTPPEELPRQNAPPAAKAASGRGYRTAERLAVLQREWPAGQPVADIRAWMNALPGPPVPNNSMVSTWARERGLRRPEGFDQGAAISAGRRKARLAPELLGWADMLAWVETVDPDLVLRGDAEQRLAQINDLRRLEGKPVFAMPADAPRLAVVQEAA
jgi:hypothetical protein